MRQGQRRRGGRPPSRAPGGCVRPIADPPPALRPGGRRGHPRWLSPTTTELVMATPNRLIGLAFPRPTAGRRGPRDGRGPVVKWPGRDEFVTKCSSRIPGDRRWQGWGRRRGGRRSQGWAAVPWAGTSRTSRSLAEIRRGATRLEVTPNPTNSWRLRPSRRSPPASPGTPHAEDTRARRSSCTSPSAACVPNSPSSSFHRHGRDGSGYLRPR